MEDFKKYLNCTYLVCKKTHNVEMGPNKLMAFTENKKYACKVKEMSKVITFDNRFRDDIEIRIDNTDRSIIASDDIQYDREYIERNFYTPHEYREYIIKSILEE